MRREHDGGSRRNLVELLDADRPASLELIDDMVVVNNLLAHVDRRSVAIEYSLDHLDRSLNAGTRRSRRCADQLARADCRPPVVGEYARGRTQRPPSRSEGSPQREWTPELACGCVQHGPHHYERAVGSDRSQPRRLHVNDERAAFCQGCARRADCGTPDRDDRTDMGGNATASQQTGDHRGARTLGDYLPISRPQLAGNDEVARLKFGGKRAPEAGEGNAGRGMASEPGRRPAGPARSDAGGANVRVRRARAQRARFDAHRPQQKQLAHAIARAIARSLPTADRASAAAA